MVDTSKLYAEHKKEVPKKTSKPKKMTPKEQVEDMNRQIANGLIRYEDHLNAHELPYDVIAGEKKYIDDDSEEELEENIALGNVLKKDLAAFNPEVQMLKDKIARLEQIIDTVPIVEIEITERKYRSTKKRWDKDLLNKEIDKMLNQQVLNWIDDFKVKAKVK